MKKPYITPRVAFFAVNPETLIAASLRVNNEAGNDISGDAKGDWGNIWDGDVSSDKE